MQLLDNVWKVGEIANGTSEWQCPPTCRLDRDYSGNDPTIQFPEGAHIKVGLPDGSTFHQGNPFEPWRVRVIDGIDHEGNKAKLLKMVGGNLNDAKQAMFVKHCTPVDWAKGVQIKLLTWFKPSLTGYPDLPTAIAHYFTNVELRGSNTFIKTLPQVLGFYVRGNSVFIMYWYNMVSPSKGTMERFDFKVPIKFEEWHRIVINFNAREQLNEWDVQIRLNRVGVKLFDWQSNDKPVRGVERVHTLAFGDERPHDFDGGTTYWEGIDLTSKEILL